MLVTKVFVRVCEIVGQFLFELCLNVLVLVSYKSFCSNLLYFRVRLQRDLSGDSVRNCSGMCVAELFWKLLGVPVFDSTYPLTEFSKK